MCDNQVISKTLFALTLAVSLNAQATPFYSVNAVTFYGNSYTTPQSAGDRFTPTNDLTVSSVGVFDYEQNGLGQSHEVGIFDNTGTLLSSAVVAAGTASRLDGDFRYMDIAPLLLMAGETYTIAAQFTNTADVVGYANVSGIHVDSNISLDALPARYIFTSGSSLEFPTIIPGASAPFFVVPNFEFTLTDGPCFASGQGANYMNVCVDNDGSIRKFESPAGKQQMTSADNCEGYALCSSAGINLKVRGYDAGEGESGFSESTVTQPGGPGTFPLSILRNTTDGIFQLTQAFIRDTGEKDLTVTMTVKNVSASSVTGVKLARYFNGDIDGTATGDLYDRTADTVWGTQGPTGHGLALFARSGTNHTTRVEYATQWDPAVGDGAKRCDVAGVTPAVPDDYAGRITFSLGTINPGASKTVSVVYRRQ